MTPEDHARQQIDAALLGCGWTIQVEELEAIVTANLQRAKRLQQAILQRAFSGRL